MIRNNINLWHLFSKGEQDQAFVCRKCWCEVKIFHEFYIRIESLHCATQANESIYVESLTERLKISLLTKKESNEFKRCPDDDYQTAEYLRDHFGNWMAGVAILYLFIFYFFSRKAQHRPTPVEHLCHWYIQEKKLSKRKFRGKRKMCMAQMSRSEKCDPRKLHTKRITKVAAKMHRKYSSELRYDYGCRESDFNWCFLSLQLR